MLKNKSYIYGFITVLLWATMATAVKALLGSIPNLEALSVSSAFAFLFLLLINVLTGNIRSMRKYRLKQYGYMALLGLIGLFIYSALYYYGLSVLTSQEACILNYLWPLMIMIFSAVILKEKLTAVKVVAMLCSFAGIVILCLGSTSQAENRLLGMAACIVAAACYGLFSVLNKKADYDQNITMMVIWFTVAVCAGALGLATETWVPLRGMQWFGIAWLGIVVDAIAYLLWALALKYAKNTATIANIAYLVPFLSVVISAIVLKEEINGMAMIALVLIIGGILLQSIYEQRRGKGRK